MASSISSSEEIVLDIRHGLPSGLRLTAADRPGMAQPVPERDIPEQPWRAMALAVAILLHTDLITPRRCSVSCARHSAR